MLDECRDDWYSGVALFVDGGGDEKLGVGAGGDGGFAVCEEVHDGVAYI